VKPGAWPVYKPEILVADAKNKFDAAGNLTDEEAKELIRRKLQGLKELIQTLKEGVYSP
jgi:chromate reductase, NAD(P)H dehydrogenase (quinone)